MKRYEVSVVLPEGNEVRHPDLGSRWLENATAFAAWVAGIAGAAVVSTRYAGHGQPNRWIVAPNGSATVDGYAVAFQPEQPR